MLVLLVGDRIPFLDLGVEYPYGLLTDLVLLLLLGCLVLVLIIVLLDFSFCYIKKYKRKEILSKFVFDKGLKARLFKMIIIGLLLLGPIISLL